MATTTNFGWTTPNDTDLVKDGAAAIRTLGQSIDTSMMDLKGGTTGQVLAKNSNSDMDFVWSADAAGMTNPMTTTGDTIYSSSGSTPARRAIGTTGQVLTVSGGIPVWSTPTAPAFSGAGVHRTSTQAIASGTNTNVLWNGESFDVGSYHDLSTNTDRLTVTNAGYYFVYASLTFGGNANAGRQMEIRRYNSGGTQQETRIFYWQWLTPNALENVQGSGVFNASASDYFIIIARQDSTATLDIRPVSNGDTFATITYLGA